MPAATVKMEMDVESIYTRLLAKSLKGAKRMELLVGYSAPYAMYVHEDLEMNHPNGGNAKYLQKPARKLKTEMVRIITRSVKAKNGLEEGMMRAGRLLLEASKEQVPVDTGFLRDSGFIQVVEES